jgi:hypothetical protein
MRLLAQLLALIAAAHCVRIPLDLDRRRSPFLHSSSGSGGGFGLVWAHAHWGRLLHMSRLVEISPRGILFVPYTDSEEEEAAASSSSVPCPASSTALCAVREGSLVLPSATEPPPPFEVGRPDRDSLLGQLALLKDGCPMEGNGWGRVHAEGSNYTATACDVVQGTHLLVYEPHAGRLTLKRQTLGPTGYLIMLIAAIINIYALAPQTQGSATLPRCNGALSVLGCIVLRLKGEMGFHRLEDEVLFWISAVVALGYLARAEQHREGGLLTLSLMAATLYRTHETPYAPILAYALAFMSWIKLFAGASDQLVLLLFTSLFCEIALRPQSPNAGVWPITLIFHIFMTFCLAKYRDLASWMPPAASAA